ncbi:MULTISPECIES: TRAP transporter large permease [Halomonadaceae]|uniref:TRAP transporter large permease protein n=1 Tax=Halomonas casei TaxID=2742613 RepID=A0ABR9F9K0_9GAMM|nr:MULTISPECIES: TRAP transporter large permease [Halomonas]MBE0401870.1 TRAP transporter large permease [Halomonas casei]WKD30502.1 TRAP transporter large permease [Halomonas sp. KG2]
MLEYILIDAVILCVLLVIGLPVPLCFAAAVLFLFTVGDFGNATFLVSAGFSQVSSVVLLAIPLYIIAGAIMSQGGIANRLIDLAESIVGRFSGGLGIVVVLATAVFGAISGMASSAVAAIGTTMIPRMVENGYDRGYATSLVSCSSVLALLLPPSASIILYGWVSGTSITAAFLAPIIPAFLLIALFCFWNWVLTRRMPLQQMPALPAREWGQEVARRGRRASLGLFMPLIILGCIYGGVTTPTEAAAVAVIYAMPLSVLIYRDMDWKDLYTTLWKAGQMTGVLLVLVFFASMLSRMLTMQNVPQLMLEGFTHVSDNPLILLLMVNLFLIVVGMLMDDASAILLATPMLMPIMHNLEIDPVHFAAIITTNLGMGLITPPTAPLLYLGSLVGKVPLVQMLSPTCVFLLFAYMPVVMLTTYFPALSLTLPRLMGY